MLQKQPFEDRRGQWWIYRSDDPDMHRPLGPFATREYAVESERVARSEGAPMPSPFGPMPT